MEFVVEVKDGASAQADKMSAAITKLAVALSKTSVETDKAENKIKDWAGVQDKFTSTITKGASGAALAERAWGGLGTVAGALGTALNPVTLTAAAVGVAVGGTIGAVVATTGAIYGLARAAIEVTGKRDPLLATFDALTQGAGQQTLAGLGRLSAAIFVQTGTLATYSKTLAAAGASSGAIVRGAHAAASASALMGDETGATGMAVTQLLAKFQGLAATGQSVKLEPKILKQLPMLGLSVGDLAKGLGKSAEQMKGATFGAQELSDAITSALVAKGKGALEAQSLGWGAIMGRVIGVKDLVMGLGDSVRPFMIQVRSLASEFFKGSTNATLAKGAVEGLMKGVFSVGTQAVRGIHILFLEAEIAALQFGIKVIRAGRPLVQLWNSADGAGKLQTALSGASVIAGALGESLKLPAAIVSTTFAVGAASLAAFGAGVLYVVGAIPRAVEATSAFVSGFIASADEAVTGFVDGIVVGIDNGVARVVAAASGLADKAVRAVKSTLDISSPSRVMIEAGEMTAGGMAVGIDRGSGATEAAAERMAVRTEGAATTRSGLRGGGSVTVNVTINQNVDGTGGAMSSIELTEEAAVALFERLARMRGVFA